MVGGFVIGVVGYYLEGDDGATAVVKGGVELMTGLGGATAGVLAGGACGSWAIVCSPLGGLAGGYLGSTAGSWINDQLEHGTFGWRPYDAVDDWLSWD